MPIGETLAQARCQAGLSVAQVSEQTRIRETVIRGIEADDYSACGGDFYARGNIRSIAKAVGADAGPLIQEYDQVHRSPGALSTVSLDELLATSARAQQRRHPDVSAESGLIVSAYGSVRRGVDLPAVRERAGSAYASVRRAVDLPAVRERRVQTYRSSGRRLNWIAVLALVLVAVLGFGVYRLVAGSRQTAVTRVAAGGRAVSHHQAGRARPRPASKNHAAVVPAPPVRAQALTPASVVAFGPGGGDNPQFAHRALGGRRGGGWRSDWYTTAQFGNLYSGTGLLLDMGRPVTLTAARIILGRARGASLQIRMGPAPALADLPPVAHAGDTGGVVRLRLAAPTHGRYVLLWFTRLPAMPSGNFQVGVYDIRLDGHA